MRRPDDVGAPCATVLEESAYPGAVRVLCPSAVPADTQEYAGSPNEGLDP